MTSKTTMSTRLVFAIAALVFMGTASADPIVGTWSKVDNAVAAFADLPSYVMPPYMSKTNYTTFATISETSDPNVFSVLWTSFPPAYNITAAMRMNGPNVWAPINGAQTLFTGVVVKRANRVYDGLTPVPFGSGTFVLSADGKKCALIALGSFKKGVNYWRNDEANLFPGIFKQSKMHYGL